jgi:hypothetical protein
VQRLTAYRHDQDNPNYPDTDAKNAEIFDDLRTRSWDEVAALLAEAYEAVLTEVQLLTAGQLISPARFYWQRGDTLLVRIPFNAYMHPLFHIAQFCADRGDRATGDRTIESMTVGISTLDPALPWQARWSYARACYYAIVGAKAKALADLPEVSATRPDLSTWSREDTDMRSMWNDSRYRALLNA